MQSCNFFFKLEFLLVLLQILSNIILLALSKSTLEPPLIDHGIPQVCFTIPLGMGEMVKYKIVYSLNFSTCSST